MDETMYRKLTASEIADLQAGGCSSDDWSLIGVAESFTPDSIKNTAFSGAVTIGKNASIRDVELIASSGGGAFGGGVKVAVLNESGGREVPIYKGLTAQIACLSAMYRHRPEAVQAIERLIEAEIEQHIPKCVHIGAGATLSRCGALTDVCVGEHAVIQGIAELTNGTVSSAEESPTHIGRGVILRDFIVADGAEVTDFAHAEKCFIGQGCRIGKGFTAQNSLFFANCELEQGEAVSVFAGPYTVSHHRSTLLIGAMCSFFNAGSGTNMSNHLYRLGPRHQGIFERGCKTGSGAYMLFPARVGAFSTLLGRHDSHSDTAYLPFSYLTEREGKTVVLPGQVLKSIGLARDLKKWPERDRRKGTKRDHIVFDALNPYTIEQILNGLASPDAGRGREIYQTAIDAWLGDVVLKRMQSGKPLEISEVSHRSWCDLAGLIAPVAEVERILEALPSMHSIHELSVALTALYEHFGEWEWAFAASLMPAEEWEIVLKKGIAASEKMLEWQLNDALKEFAPAMRVGYADEAEFEAIHGTPATNPFLTALRQEFEAKRSLAETLQKGINH